MVASLLEATLELLMVITVQEEEELDTSNKEEEMVSRELSL